MRKRIIDSLDQDAAPSAPSWLNMEDIAEVEVTSENPAHPIESALLPGFTSGWHAAGPGKQMIRLLFAQPQPLNRILLKFEDHSAERTQQYVLRWSGDRGQSFHEIVRQQWNFSPSGSPTETEIHDVELPAVAVLELSIIPDISGGSAIATLEQLRLA